MSAPCELPPGGASKERPPGISLEDRYLAEDGRLYLTGLQALVRMLLDRQRHDGRRGHHGSVYVTGYEGSPLAGYDLEIQRRKTLMDAHRVLHAPAVNEELAATALAGTQLAGEAAALTTDGVTGIWYGKAPGLDRATDAIRHAVMTGTSPQGGVVALVGDDPSAKSSSIPCSSEPALADLQMPTLYPADAHEVQEYGLHAVELSRAGGLWTAMKVVTDVADGASTATVTPLWMPPDLTGLPGGLRAYTHTPSGRLLGAELAALERSLHQTRLPIAREYLRRSGLNRILGATGQTARIGIVSAGKTYLDVRQALTSLGLGEGELTRKGVRLLKLGAVWPVEPSVVREFAQGLTEIVVVEDKRAFLETAVKDILYGTPDAPAVMGKRGPEGARLFSDVGQLGPDSVATGLATRLREYDGCGELRTWEERRPRERTLLPLAARTPYFCSGCPHNLSTKPPEGALVGGGIGCHAMVLMMPQEQVGNVVGLCQMGGEGAQWIGMAPFVDTPHFLQNLGDGTFAHSGSLAIRAAVAADVPVTFKILFNSAVAMTGGQDAAGGQGGLGRLVATVLAEGVNRVVVTTQQPRSTRKALRREHIRTYGRVEVRHRDELADVQQDLAARTGVTVLVHDQECAAEKRRKRKRGTAPTPAARVMINERVCEGCGDCGKKSNCLSVRPVETEYGRKTQIHQSSCNLDYSCLDGDCPSFLTVTPGSRGARTLVPDAGTLPEPVAHRTQQEARIRITGVGGTGVVTVAQILATAASLEGRHVRALDQTGLAQKGGAVVSDIKITTSPSEEAARLAGGECTLYLGCDSLVAVDPAQLEAADPARTTAVISTAEVPTGRMVTDPAASFPAQDSIRFALDGRVREAHYLAADQLAQELFDDEQLANMILVGAAYQTGSLPLRAEAIEEAIRLNGVRVQANLQAFRHGRRALAGEARPEQGDTFEGAPQSGDDLRDLLRDRADDLTEYQDARYAQVYTDFIERVRTREAAAVPGSDALATAVARNLYKLMAYKDEYEVARLSLDPALDETVRRQWGAGARASYRLHPPLFRALGMQRKITLGPWFRPAFRVLRGMRRLRGTPLDPFRAGQVRRVERELIAEYRDTVDAVLPRLDAATLPDAVALAELPDMVRGYEDIKLASVARYRAHLTDLRQDFHSRAPR